MNGLKIKENNMKTALIQLLHYLHLDNDCEEINESLQIHDIVMYVDKLLKKEKQQIIDAYETGAIENYSLYKGVDYYKDNYEQ